MYYSVTVKVPTIEFLSPIDDRLLFMSFRLLLMFSPDRIDDDPSESS